MPDPISPRPTRVRRTALALVLVAGVTSLVACSSTADDDAASSTGAGPLGTTTAQPSTSATFTSVSLDNCGTAVTLEAPPTRVVTIKSTSTEMLLALGLEDSIIGTAFVDGPVPDEYADAYAAIPVLSDKVPGQEALLESAPDLVYGGWESNFAADGAGDRAGLAALGIATYVSPAACKEDGYKPDPLTFDEVFDEIREIASVFGVEDRADAIVAAQRAELAAVALAAPDEPTTALWYSSGADTPYVGAGIGAPQMVMDAAGLTNIFADVHDTWSSVGWEEVVAADPDVIVLVDAAWNTAESKIEMLEANPATSQLTAVRESRYLTVPFPAAEAGFRSAAAVTSLAEQLAALAPVG